MPPAKKRKSSRTTFDSKAAIETFVNFCQGSTIQEAARLVNTNMTGNTLTENDKVAMVRALAAAAIAPKAVIEEIGAANALARLNFTIGDTDEYNHSLAKLAGNLLLEHNEYNTKNSMIEKIGGRSLFSCDTSLLDGDAKTITEKNKKKYSMEAVNAVKELVTVANFAAYLDGNEMETEPAAATSRRGAR